MGYRLDLGKCSRRSTACRVRTPKSPFQGCRDRRQPSNGKAPTGSLSVVHAQHQASRAGVNMHERLHLLSFDSPAPANPLPEHLPRVWRPCSRGGWGGKAKLVWKRPGAPNRIQGKCAPDSVPGPLSRAHLSRIRSVSHGTHQVRPWPLSGTPLPSGAGEDPFLLGHSQSARRNIYLGGEVRFMNDIKGLVRVRSSTLSSTCELGM